MKYKFFSAGSQAEIEKAVNDWVGKQSPAPQIIHSDTKMQVLKIKATSGAMRDVPTVSVGVWFS